MEAMRRELTKTQIAVAFASLAGLIAAAIAVVGSR
jgi:hypothetical protein